MKRTTVMLPEDAETRLQLEARRRGTSVADLVREAVDAYLREIGRPRSLSFIGIGAGPADLSEKADEYLGEAIEQRTRQDAAR